MGVNDLWQILEPVKQHAHLRSLQGKTLAVDLSLWVCEALTVKKMVGAVVKPHLRNLFFRISSLTLMGVKLLFVMEGEAPRLKADVMSKRNEARYGPPQTRAHRPTRSCFKAFLKECLDLLECLGIPWVQAAGEAEAMCAYLNAHGYVDGCLTNDGDAFLYGALTVYRNFTMNTKDPHVDCYVMSSIERELGLDRDSLIGLAVLLGCDYLPKGVPGVGKEQALKLVHSLKGQSLLQRFDQWKEESDSLDLSPATLRKPAHCSVCAHPGSPKDHERNGCRLCGSENYCEPHDYEYRCLCAWHRAEHSRQQNAVENSIKKRACSCKGFPFHEVIREFQLNKDRLTRKICWQRPDLLSFQVFALERMQWPSEYACEKLMVLLTHHDMTERKSGRTGPSQLQPLRINCPRIRNGTSCFEIQWQKPEHYVTVAAPSANLPPGEPAVLTVEEASLFEAAYPEVVAQYQKQVQESRGKKAQSKKNKSKGGGLPALEEVEVLLSGVKLSREVAPGQGPRPNQKSPRDGQWPKKATPAADSWLFLGAPVEAEAPSPSPLRLGRTQRSAAGGHPSSEHQHDGSVIEALQLSTIDWEGTSFSTSPGAQDPPEPGPARGQSALPLSSLTLKERVCARAWELPQASSPQDEGVDLEARSWQKMEGALAVESRPSSEPPWLDRGPQDGPEKSAAASRRAPFCQAKPSASAAASPGNPAGRPPGPEPTRVGPEPHPAPKRDPKKSVCLPCSSSDEEAELARGGRNPKGRRGPRQRPPARLESRVPGAPSEPRPEPRVAPTEGPSPLAPGEDKDARLLLESPLPLAQRLKLRFQSR
ncbi:flap endonuclease GEN homolog 1 [Dromiciops gliroides]|uniref:flap endonuclease GEN homolog 1 n=1 Tax=Dromiciops gliroides TaxID=33562 RepID=UPI001CC47C12|nr:flap endonuclease GEN homolog 1 [Dromiciops gliroides]